MRPWLSVVMPVHNGQRFLGATLASALAEKPDGVEFILLDSSDDLESSRKIATAFTALNLRWIASQSVKPWQTKTNRAVEMSTAPHVVMLHQDDLWQPGHLQALRASMSEAPDAALSVGPSDFIDAKGKTVGRLRLPFRPGQIGEREFCSTLLVQNSIAIPSPLIRRDMWLSVGGLDEELWYTADWDLYLKLGFAGPVHVRPAATTAFRIHRASLTVTGARDAAAFEQQLLRVLTRHLPSCPEGAARTERLAFASAMINTFLAASFHGTAHRPAGLLATLVRLGPLGLLELLRKSRLVDRVLPRLRLKLFGWSE